MQIFNTMTRQKEEFVPQKEGEYRIYVCGPTVYNYIHIGNARPMIVFDTLRRYLEYCGNKVYYVSNITDIDDKLIKKGQEEGTSMQEVARKFEAEYIRDSDGLNVKAPTVRPRATEHIGEIIHIVKDLVDSGHAYVARNGDVYFRVKSDPGYGKLSHLNLDDLESGNRELRSRMDDDLKEDPADFAVWKAAKPGEPYWESPWGHGRPGWHIECSAMARKHLGKTIDLHAGGQDLIFPHHENEIAQSEAASGVPFAKVWMHSGPLRVRDASGHEEKMSKSLGNFWTIRDALKDTEAAYGEGNGAEVLRFFLLRSQYRSPISFSSALIEEAQKALVRLYGALKGREAAEGEVDWSEKYAAQFKAAMDDDFNTPLAIAAMFELATEINRTGDPVLVRQLKGLGAVLNILQLDPENFLKGGASDADEARINALIEERREAKKAKNFARADEIRKSLLDEGIVLMDGPQGTTWRRI